MTSECNFIANEIRVEIFLAVDTVLHCDNPLASIKEI